MKKITITILMLGILGVVTARAEDINFSTYYPAPFGSYDTLRLVPAADKSEPCESGSLYVNKNSGDLQFCQQDRTWGPISAAGSGGAFIKEEVPAGSGNFYVYLRKLDIDPWQRVSIGGNSPIFKLTLEEDGGILAKGTHGSGKVLADMGIVSRFLWYPRKSSIRAGRTTLPGNQWEDWQNGEYSAGFGDSSISSGKYSTAFGSLCVSSGESSFTANNENQATGPYSATFGSRGTASGAASVTIGAENQAKKPRSTAVGYKSIADDDSASAFGNQSLANGNSSVVMGELSRASGQGAVAMGNVAVATAKHSTALGDHVTASRELATSLGSFMTTQGYYSLGIGLRGSDAGDIITNDSVMAVIGGKMGIGTTTPNFKLTLDNNGSILASGIHGLGQPLPADFATQHVPVFLWYPYKSAFRAGYHEGQWADNLIGEYSAAFGYMTTASGSASTAFGANSIASGTCSFASGLNVEASGPYSIAIGSDNNSGCITNASGNYAIAIGNHAKADAEKSIGIGHHAEAYASNSISLGNHAYANGQYSLALGQGWQNDAGGSHSVVMGLSVNTSSTADHSMIIGLEDFSASSVTLSQANTLAIMGGNVGIGVDSPTTKLMIEGLIPEDSGTYVLYNTTTGDFYYYSSSRRYKDNIQPLKDDFAKILQVQSVSYTDINSGMHEIGVIADDVEAMGLKNLIHYNDAGEIIGFKYDKMALYVLEVMKGQQKELEALDALSDCYRHPDKDQCR